MLVNEVAHNVHTASLQLFSTYDSAGEKYLKDGILGFCEERLQLDGLRQCVRFRQSTRLNTVPDEEDVFELILVSLGCRG